MKQYFIDFSLVFRLMTLVSIMKNYQCKITVRNESIWDELEDNFVNRSRKLAEIACSTHVDCLMTKGEHFE